MIDTADYAPCWPREISHCIRRRDWREQTRAARSPAKLRAPLQRYRQTTERYLGCAQRISSAVKRPYRDRAENLTRQFWKGSRLFERSAPAGLQCLRLRDEETRVELKRPRRAPHDFGIAAVVWVEQDIMFFRNHNGAHSHG
jgi:hypothetical protein